MALITTIPVISFSRNFPVLTVGAEAECDVTLKKGAKTILSETYYPDDTDRFDIDIADLLTEQLTISIPESAVEEQSEGYDDFTLTITESGLAAAEYAFRVIKGGVQDGVSDYSDFLSGNILTWQPQVKRVKIDDPEYITYYAEDPSCVMAKAWFLTNPEISVATLDHSKLYSIDVTYSRIRALFPTGYLPAYIDIWIVNQAGKTTWTQRYELIDEHHEYDDLFLFEPSLPGLDTIRFTGQREEKDDHDLYTALFGLEKRDYGIDFNRTSSKGTGKFRTRAESDWAREFFASVNRWWRDDGKWKRITVLKWEVERIYNEINSYIFDFALSVQEPLRKVERDELEDPEVPFAYDYSDDYNNDYLIQQ